MLTNKREFLLRGEKPYFNWVGGKDAALDVTVVTPLQDNTMPGAAHTPGHTLTYAYQRKINGQRRSVGDRGLRFCQWWWSPLGDGTQMPRGR